MRPEDIENRTFTHTLRGYDRDEVRSFLHAVADSAQELHDRLSAAEGRAAAASGAIDTEPADTTPDDAASAEAESVGTVAEDRPASLTVEGTDLDTAEQVIVDRFGALGDRIADLLRHADESAAAIVAAAENDAASLRSTAVAEASQVRTNAEQHAAQLLAEARAIRAEVDAYRDEVTAELDSARTEQATALADAKSAAEAEVETFRLASIEEIEKLRSDARSEVEALRGSAATEVEQLRSSARAEADEARQVAIADGRATIAEHEAEAARLREEAEHDRRTAKTELDEVRTEVSSLLEQARTQSEFIKQEADEIIRTKVRANFEQAQARLDVLRNTEISSRERILRAQTELSSALNRLDAEPAPELDPSSAPAVIEEAERRQAELFESSSSPVGDTEPVFTEASETLDPFDTDVVEVGEVGQATFEADVAEANQQIDAENEARSPLSAFGDGEPTPGLGGSGEPGFAAAEYAGDDGFGATEHVEAESPGDASLGADEVADATPEDAPGFGPSTLAESLPPETTGIGGPAEEDALARLVRDAMQEAVDSARKTD